MDKEPCSSLAVMTWEKYFYIWQNVGSRYFLFAGMAFLIFYIVAKNRTGLKKIQSRFPKRKDYLREIGYSFVAIFIFALVPFLLVSNPAIRPYTTWYKEIDQHGWWYFFFAFPIMFVMHDTYFYWTHRLMHHPKIFRFVHLVHHQSTNPSPWAAYAFHPFESIMEAGIAAIFLFTIPIHPLHLGIFFLMMIIYNVYGHLGYELYPKWFSRHWLGKWINTSVNHNQHHQFFKGNYGLYFLFWDRIMGTIRSDYEDRFEEVKSKTDSTA